jgi:hypothetical protein
MSATSAPFGFRPAYHPSGLDRARAYSIASATAVAMLKYAPVELLATGVIQTNSTADADVLGIFMGCEFTDANGKYTVSPFWPAGQTLLAGTTATAWVIDDPDMVYEVQADGSIAATAIGDQADVSNIAAGSTTTGLSACTLSASLAGAGTQEQWRIVGFGKQLDNAAGDAFTIVQVQLAQSAWRANKAAI